MTRFPIGGIFYNCKAARRGCLEAICIKKYKVYSGIKTGGAIRLMYVDTLNGLWNEDELCSKTQAIDSAKLFFDWQLTQIAAAIRKCPTCA